MDLTSFAVNLRPVSVPRPSPAQPYELLILGGGPAALSAAIYAARKMISLALITKDFGGQMNDTLQIENYVGFQSISGEDLALRFADHVRKFRVPIAEKETVRQVRRGDGGFETVLEHGEVYRSTAVIFATGKRYRQLNVPGERELLGHGISYCAICDAPFFKERRVVVVGGGNSAFTAALDLLKLAREVTLINVARGWQADEVMFEAVQQAGRARLLDEHEVTRIEGKDNVSAVQVRDRRTGAQQTIPADGVFVEIGLTANSNPVRGLAALNAAGELLVDCQCRTNVEGLFGAGDVTTVPYNQIVISAGEGAKAALSAHDFLVRRKGHRGELT